MLDTIAPGSTISIKVTKRPTNRAAEKTILRLLAKDRSVKREAERLRKARKANYRQAPRGGRLWSINVVKQAPVKATVGVSKTIVASLDVLTDLRSVAKFVEVAPA